MVLGDRIRQQSMTRGRRWAGRWAISIDGREDPLPLDAVGVAVYGASGLGLPPLDLATSPYAVADGAALHGVALEPRPIVLRLTTAGADPGALAALLSLVAPDRIGDETAPFVLSYTGAARTLALRCVLAGQPEHDGPIVILRFLALDPAWFTADLTTRGLPTRATYNPTGYVLERMGGQWGTLGAGPGAAVRCLTYGPDGRLYAGLAAAPGVRVWDGATWATVGSGITAAVNALRWYGGTLYAGLAAAPGVLAWDGATWSPLGAGVDGAVYALAVQVAADAYLLVGGAFTGYLKRWRIAGAYWGSYGATNGAVRALAALPGGGIAAAGDFSQIAGVAAAHVARNTPLYGWQALGAGLDAPVAGVAVLPDGRIVAGGPDEYTSNGVYLGFCGVWNGASWAPTARDLATPLLVDAAGVLWCGGNAAAPTTWAGAGRAHALPIALSVTGTTPLALAVAADGRCAVGGDGNGASSVPGLRVVHTPGTAATAPTFTIQGPGALRQIHNLTSGDTLHLSASLVVGETLTLDLAARTATSTVRGALLDVIAPDSQFGSFRLLPGDNALAVCAAGEPQPTVTISFVDRYLTLDAADR